jgi:hypothetical protein
MWTQAALGVGLTAFSMDMVNSAFPAGGAGMEQHVEKIINK